MILFLKSDNQLINFKNNCNTLEVLNSLKESQLFEL